MTVMKTGWKRVVQWSVVGLCATGAAGQAAANWAVTTIDRAGAVGTQLWGINDLGTVVGSDSLGGYLYSGGAFTALDGIANAVQLTGFGVANNGTVVGSWVEAVDASTAITHGFIYQGGSYTTWDMPVAGNTFTQIRSISLDGRYIAGYYGVAPGTPAQGFVYDLVNAQLQTYSSTGQMILHGVNSRGVAVGSLSSSAGAAGGGVVTSTAGAYTVIPTTPGVSSNRPSFRGVNDSGMVTGFTNMNGFSTAIFGSVANGGSFEALTIVGAASATAEGLNNQNTVVGFYTDASGAQHGFMAAAVPEPTTALLFAGGLGVLGWARRRQGQAANA